MATETWKEGNPIPERYRDRLYAWTGGGYDGCLWEPNFGVVNHDGHWVPFLSTGSGGLDCETWYSRRIRELKADCGFGERADPRDAFERNRGDAGLEARYRKYAARRRELDGEYHRRTDGIFMGQVALQEELGGPVHPRDIGNGARPDWEVYPLQPDLIDDSCRRLCEERGKSAGLVADVLDGLSEEGYRVACVCSDCGRLFRLCDCDSFADCIDRNEYRGDGGIGCVYTRILCEDCLSESRCPECGQCGCPTAARVREGHAYDHYSHQAYFIAKWLGVCDDCAEAFYHGEGNGHWADEVTGLVSGATAAEEQLGKYLDAMRDGGMAEGEVAELRSRNRREMRVQWIERVNGLRDGMQADAERFYHEANDRAADRLEKEDMEYELL